MEELIVCLIGLIIAIAIAAGYRNRLEESKELLGELCDVSKEFSELLISLRDAIEDDKVTKEEVAKIIKEGNEVIDEGSELLTSLREFLGLEDDVPG